MDKMFASMFSLVAVLRDRVQNRNDAGATMVEYALIVVAIAVVVFVAAQFVGSTTSKTFGSIGTDIQG